MPKFGRTSIGNLLTTKPALVRLFNEVIKDVDCSVIEGRRTWERQNELYYSVPRRTSLKGGESKHNPPEGDPEALVSAVDVVPYPVKWPEYEPEGSEARRLIWARLYMFVGYVRGVAFELGIPIRCGADWDGDFELNDQEFHDLPHFELIEVRP